MIEMAEDMFGDASGEFSDEFSLASGIDDINYDDPFMSHQHISDGGVGFYSMTPQDSQLHSRIRGMAACSFDSSNDHGNVGQITDKCDLQSPFLTGSPRQPSLDPVKPNKISSYLLNSIDAKKSKKQPSNLILKSENVAIKARKASTKSMMKHSKSDGLLTLALRAKYRKSSFQHSNSDYSISGTGEEEGPATGAANATWGRASGSEGDGLHHRTNSAPSGKSSSMQDLLRQSKAHCKSQFLLRQSSASSLSKRNSFQSIKYVNEKLDVSSLLPAKQYSKSRRRFSFPNAATAAGTKSTFPTQLVRVEEVAAQHTAHGGTGDMTDSLLHDACRLFPNSDTVVETALRVDPDSVRRSVVHTGDQDDNCIYGYPINLALTHGASEKILKTLVRAGPDVLTFKDGTDCGASLGIALSSKTCNWNTVELLIAANDNSAQVADRRGNYPLHIAVSYGRSIDIVMRLYAVYPKAQGMRNFHSQTPLDIAIQSSRCPEDVTDFLRSVSIRSSYTNDTVINTKKEDDHNQFNTSLEEGLDDIMEINCL